MTNVSSVFVSRKRWPIRLANSLKVAVVRSASVGARSTSIGTRLVAADRLLSRGFLFIGFGGSQVPGEAFFVLLQMPSFSL